VTRRQTPFRCAGLRVRLWFFSAPRFGQMNAITSRKDARNRVGKRSSGSTQFSG